MFRPHHESLCPAQAEFLSLAVIFLTIYGVLLQGASMKMEKNEEKNKKGGKN
jgi:hypothetical protein